MTEYVIGYDLNENVSQISFSEIHDGRLKAVGGDGNDEKLGIPTVLCKRNGVNQWYFGREAITCANRGDGTLVGKLLSFAISGARLEIEGEAYDPIDLLILFFKRSLNIISAYVNPESVVKLVITVDHLDQTMIDILEKIVAAVSIDRENIVFQTYDESIYYYMIHQASDLWQNNVMVFDYSTDYMKSYELWMNRNTTPVVGFVDYVGYEHIKLPKFMIGEEFSDNKEESLDELILQTIRSYFAGRSIGAVYLIGEGFEGDWFKNTKNFLLMGRHVFQGKNLYSKGACFCASDKYAPKEINRSHIFLGKDKLKANSGLKMRVNGKEEYVVLVDAGETWYDAENALEFILEEGNSVDIIVTPLDGGRQRTEEIVLGGLPNRPNRATRLRLEATFESDVKMHIKISDLGFGEFYISSGKVWERDIEFKL
ncbi:MAG: DUF5716 family protein [Lachnospiraceae bacterium]|nr:DUF5716 family protein [Lachnospiraceae bacterium]